MGIEFPWLDSVFGAIQGVEAHSMRLSSLDIDFDDTFLLTIKHEGGSCGHFLLDVVSRKAERSLEILSEDIYISWNGKPDGLSEYDISAGEERRINVYEDVLRDTRYADNIIENAYVDEMHAFFDTLAGRPALRHTFERDAGLLEIITEINSKTGR
jgi:hypothetical protein